jgi:1,4-alpha-glucan branching enzyme
MVNTLSGIRLLHAPFAYKHSAGSSSIGDRNNTHVSLLFKKNSSSRMIFAVKSSYDSDSSSSAVAASEKVLVPGVRCDGSSPSTDQLEVADTVSMDTQVLHDVATMKMEDDRDIKDDDNDLEATSDYSQFDGEKDSVASPAAVEDVKAKDLESSGLTNDISKENDMVRERSIPPPGTGQRIYEIDPLLRSHREHLDYRYSHYRKMRDSIDKYEGGLETFSRGHEKFGFNRRYICSFISIAWCSWIFFFF